MLDAAGKSAANGGYVEGAYDAGAPRVLVISF